MAGESLQWQDLHVGLSFRSPTRTVTETDVVMFAAMTGDYSELHTSRAFAEKTQYGQRVAHGLLGLAVGHGLMWPRTNALRDCAIAFLGISDWRFRGPIFLGDTIHVDYEVVEVRDSRSNPDQGICTFGVKIVNQRGEVVQEGRKALLMSKVPLDAARDT
ncbi:MAG: MaoC family dehydratase N-terminal domain-containing protein [Actinobacteria bacterium]|nr:MaoC family dehydratase N-terminal domain-containing protein [Actinomycetota bacterium]